MLSVSQMEEAISRFGLNPKGGAINEWRRQTQFENEEVNPDKDTDVSVSVFYSGCNLARSNSVSRKPLCCATC